MRLLAHTGVELISASTQAIMNVRRCADIILPILEKRRAVCETFMQTLCENNNMIVKAEQLQEQRRSGPGLARAGASSAYWDGLHKGSRLLVNPLTGRYNAIRFPAVRSEWLRNCFL